VFCAGEMRRQELSGSVQCSGRFVEDRIEGLEDVRHPRGDVAELVAACDAELGLAPILAAGSPALASAA